MLAQRPVTPRHCRATDLKRRDAKANREYAKQTKDGASVLTSRFFTGGNRGNRDKNLRSLRYLLLISAFNRR